MSHPLQEQQPPGTVLREMKGPAGGNSGRGRGGGAKQDLAHSPDRRVVHLTDGREMCQGRGGEGGVHPSPWGTQQTLEAGSGHHLQVCVQGEG